MSKLVVQVAGGAPIVHEWSVGVVAIGRGTDNVVVISDASVSRRHAEITSRDGATMLRDLDSANGSLVNGEPVTESPLETGDVIHFGTVRSTFVVERADVPPGPAKEAARPPPASGKPRRLVGGMVLLLVGVAGAGAGVAFLSPRPPGQDVRRASGPAVVVDSRPVATRKFWDRFESIMSAGSQTARNFPLDQYPTLPNGLYDFQRLDNAHLEELLDRLMQRARYLSEVSWDLAALDPSNVDPDLVAYRQEVSTEWKDAASLDSNAVNLVWTVRARRLDPTTADASTSRLLEAPNQASRAGQEHQENADQIARLASAWLAQRDQFVILGTQVEAKAKATGLLLAARYPREFK